MKVKRKIPHSLLGMMLLILVLGVPSFAEAGRGHHRDHYHGYYHNHHHHNGYAVIINQPRGYYNRPYYQTYTQPVYSYNYYPVPAPVSPPVTGYAPNVLLDIYTGNGHFMMGY